MCPLSSFASSGLFCEVAENIQNGIRSHLLSKQYQPHLPFSFGSMLYYFMALPPRSSPCAGLAAKRSSAGGPWRRILRRSRSTSSWAMDELGLPWCRSPLKHKFASFNRIISVLGRGRKNRYGETEEKFLLLPLKSTSAFNIGCIAWQFTRM